VLVGKSRDPIKGSVPGPARDDIVPGRFMVDPHTLENLGFRWYVSGDHNRNASVSVDSRKTGDKNWSRGMNLLRVFQEIANQDYGPYRTGNLFAGSVLFLQPGTSYEIRFTMVDPDGGSPAEPKIIEVSTRSEPQASEGGKTIHASPKSALNLKLNNYPAGVLAYNNTLCCAQKGFTPPSIWQNGHFWNNLFMGGRGYAMETGTVTAYSTLDYNGCRRNSKEQFLKWRDPQRKTGRYQTLEAFHKATGYAEHGLEVDYDIFRRADRPEEGEDLRSEELRPAGEAAGKVR
jgi:hypothetical protein